MVAFVSGFNVIIGFVVFCSFRDHLLNALLRLEFIVLSIFLSFILALRVAGTFYSLVYLVIAACEGALGLSVLICMGRSHGGDYLRGFTSVILK